MSLIQNPVQVLSRKLMVPHREVDITYPLVVGTPNPLAGQKINAAILTLVNRLIALQGDQLINQGYTNPKFSMTGWYELKTNERGILSLSIGNYTIAHPAAHGLTVIKSLTFDIQTGNTYSLEELFKPDSDYVQVLSDIVCRQIAARNIPLLGEFKGIRPDQDYYIADKSLVIYFQAYEITPYYVGLPMFPISVFELQDIVKEGGPLGRMATND